jgi:hypothetical protein
MGVNGLSRSDDFSRILNWSFEGRSAGLRLEQLQIHDGVTFGDLTRPKASLKYREIPAKTGLSAGCLETVWIYDFKVDLSSKP